MLAEARLRKQNISSLSLAWISLGRIIILGSKVHKIEWKKDLIIHLSWVVPQIVGSSQVCSRRMSKKLRQGQACLAKFGVFEGKPCMNWKDHLKCHHLSPSSISKQPSIAWFCSVTMNSDMGLEPLKSAVLCSFFFFRSKLSTLAW